MSKHTHGPWTVHDLWNNTRTVENGGVFEVEEAHYDVKERLEDGRDFEGVIEANARLIAAAPELLEACVAAIEATGGSHLWNGWTRKFLVLAENALRKAGVDPATIEAKQTIGPEDPSVESV